MMKVLVVDECPVFRETARCILECEGFEVLEARDGLAGMQRALEDTPDLIVLDLGLSGLDGIDVCSRLREEKETRGIPIVIWSSSMDPMDRLRAAEAGASAYVARTLPPLEFSECARDEDFLALDSLPGVPD